MTDNVTINRDPDEELLPRVDCRGQVTGSIRRHDAHDGSKVMHPVVHLHLFNSEGKLYLQFRPAWKKIQPSKWDTACGGHISYGESVETALQREVEEELGICGIAAEKIGEYIFENPVETEYVYIFRTVYDGNVHPSKDELSGGRFFSREEIMEKIGQGFFTPNFESEYLKYIACL